MATFVLVHGAWLGGWFWGRVRNALRDAGHNVFTPTLTGLGERVHLATPDTDLNTHIDDIVNVLEYEELNRVVLVGFSYGGMVIPGVAARAAKRISHLVYLDAFVPRDGESMADLIGAEFTQQFQAAAKAEADGWRVPAFLPLELLGITAEVDVRWVKPRLVPFPMKAITTPLRLGDSGAAAVPSTYIRCTREPLPFFPAQVERARAAGWKVLEIDAMHGAPATHPKQVAELLAQFKPRVAAP